MVPYLRPADASKDAAGMAPYTIDTMSQKTTKGAILAAFVPPAKLSQVNCNMGTMQVS